MAGLATGLIMFGGVGMVNATLLTIFDNETDFLNAAGGGLNFLDFTGETGSYATYDSGTGVVFSTGGVTGNDIVIGNYGDTTEALFANRFVEDLTATFSPRRLSENRSRSEKLEN